MATVADAPLGRLLREAGPETAAAFVAGLFDARGWTVERAGDRRLVLANDGHETRLAVLHPADGRYDAAGVNRVVAVDGAEHVGPDDTEVVGVATLHRQLAYAIDQADAETLQETHLGWSPDAVDGRAAAGVSGARAGAEAGKTDRRNWYAGRPRAVVALVAVAVLLAGSAVALAGGVGVGERLAANVGPAGDDPADGSAGANPDTSASGTPTATPLDPAEGGADTDADATDETYADAPPGVVGPNDINIHRIARAFWEQLDQRSYRMTVTYRELVDGNTAGLYTETLRVESNERYTVRVSRLGTLRTRPLTIAGTELYADGSVRYERFDNGTVRRERTAAYDPFMINATQYLGWFLSVENSSIVGQQTRKNTTSYRIVTEGEPDPRFTDASGTVYITEDGLVGHGLWEYNPREEPDVRVRFEIRVTDVGSTRVTEPDWVGNETGEAPTSDQ
jgi:hypothetical protein